MTWLDSSSQLVDFVFFLAAVELITWLAEQARRRFER